MSGDGVLRQEVTFMVHDAADRFVVAFDDERAVANAGVMLPALLAPSVLAVSGGCFAALPHPAAATAAVASTLATAAA